MLVCGRRGEEKHKRGKWKELSTGGEEEEENTTAEVMRFDCGKMEEVEEKTWVKRATFIIIIIILFSLSGTQRLLHFF